MAAAPAVSWGGGGVCAGAAPFRGLAFWRATARCRVAGAGARWGEVAGCCAPRFRPRACPGLLGAARSKPGWFFRIPDSARGRLVYFVPNFVASGHLETLAVCSLRPPLPLAILRPCVRICRFSLFPVPFSRPSSSARRLNCFPQIPQLTYRRAPCLPIADLRFSLVSFANSFPVFSSPISSLGPLSQFPCQHCTILVGMFHVEHPRVLS